MILIIKGCVFYANTGDTRCLIQHSGGIFASRDHSPSNDRQRLAAAGARVVKVMGIQRVDGNLSLARSLGDAYMKSKGIIADPDVGLVC